jgi:hypothetical protein
VDSTEDVEFVLNLELKLSFSCRTLLELWLWKHLRFCGAAVYT